MCVCVIQYDHIVYFLPATQYRPASHYTAGAESAVWPPIKGMPPPPPPVPRWQPTPRPLERNHLDSLNFVRECGTDEPLVNSPISLNTQPFECVNGVFYVQYIHVTVSTCARSWAACRVSCS